ncbi:pfs domain-containing protein [Apiospora arundinis]|uniref:Pfs domain-containing protein n=1 Tax=Apiospora arundinis TaxID=335852 RepID=A0ABR2I9P7_9PEZI
MSDQHQPVLPSAEPRLRLQQDDYTIAIICPMGDEISPVLALLDERHANLPTSRDQNAYKLGRMGPHNIVVSAMPTIGNNAAAMVITQLCNDFGRVRFGLLVGVGGGIPDEDYEDDNLHDIRLGDVVVSESRGSFGGVVQFDRGKETTLGFEPTGHLNKPPHVLASTVEGLKAEHNLHGNRVLQFLDEMLAEYPRMKEKYSYPGAERDCLFEAAYTHQSGKSCKKCDSTQVVKRKQRPDLHPRIHYGTIGSSNIVVENVTRRDELRDSMKVICVEMEAAGLMEAFPCLVIRGISDYADSHKNKRWQPYAAATAAAYTKELLLQIPPDEVRHVQTIAEVLQGISTKMDQVDQNMRKIERRTHST